MSLAHSRCLINSTPPHGGKPTGGQEVEEGDTWSIRPLRVSGAKEGGEVLCGPKETQNNGRIQGRQI